MYIYEHRDKEIDSSYSVTRLCLRFKSRFFDFPIRAIEWSLRLKEGNTSSLIQGTFDNFIFEYVFLVGYLWMT